MISSNKSLQVAWIGLGSICSLLFVIVSSAILSRYFSKGDYGTYKQVMYVYSTLLTVFSLGLPGAFAYFLPNENKNRAKSLINKINGIFMVLGVIFSLSLLLLSNCLAKWLNNEDLSLALKLFAPVPFFLLPTLGIEGILATYNKGAVIASYNILTKVATLLIVVLPVISFQMSYKGAIICFDIACFLTFVVAMKLKLSPVKCEQYEATSITYREIIKFSLPLMLASLWGAIANSSDQFFISRYYGKEEFAVFSNGAIEFPFVGMVVSACSTVLAPVYASFRGNVTGAKQELLRLWCTVSDKVCLLTYPLLIYTFIFSDYIMIFLYGEKFENAYIYYCIKSFKLFLAFAVYGPFLINVGKGKIYTNIHALMAFLIVVSEFIVVSTIDSPYAISVACTISRVFCIFLLLSVVAKTLDTNISKLLPLEYIWKISVSSFSILIIIRLIIVNFTKLGTLGTLLVGFLFFTALYLLIIKFVKLDYYQLIRSIKKS